MSVKRVIFKKTYIPARKGGGVHFPFGQPNKAEMKRIEMLGKMNDRRNYHLAHRKPRGLLLLAREYEKIKCPTLANQVRLEARQL